MLFHSRGFSSIHLQSFFPLNVFISFEHFMSIYNNYIIHTSPTDTESMWHQISAPSTDSKLEINHKAETVENTLSLAFPYPGHPKYIHKAFSVCFLERTLRCGYS